MKKNLFLLGVTLIFCTLLAEAVYRYQGYYISYNERSSGGDYVSPFETREEWGYGWYNTPKPFTEITCNKEEFDYKWMSNNEGLRGENITIDKSGKRTLIFGDSFTEGMGAPDDSTYPQLLENLIHKNLDSTAQVINCGPSGSDIFSEYKLFSDRMLKYQPDYVIVTFNSTDLYEYTIRGGFERFKENNRVEYRKAPWFEPLYAKSYLVRMIVHDVFGYDYRFLRKKESEKTDSLAIQAVCSVIDSFSSLCKTNGCLFGMVFHPMYMEYPAERYLNAPIIAYCEKTRIPYVDEYEFLARNGYRNIPPEIYWPRDRHFNSNGYEILAKCAFELFTKNGWLTNTPPAIAKEE